MGTHLGVLKENYQWILTWQGLEGFQRSFLDKRSLSIGRVNPSCGVFLTSCISGCRLSIRLGLQSISWVWINPLKLRAQFLLKIVRICDSFENISAIDYKITTNLKKSCRYCFNNISPSKNIMEMPSSEEYFKKKNRPVFWSYWREQVNADGPCLYLI